MTRDWSQGILFFRKKCGTSIRREKKAIPSVISRPHHDPGPGGCRMLNKSQNKLTAALFLEHDDVKHTVDKRILNIYRLLLKCIPSFEVCSHKLPDSGSQ